MKFKPLFILGCGLLLASCATQTSKQSSEQVGISESAANVSSDETSADAATNSSLDGYPTSWSETDLEEMAQYIGDNVIPFPVGITENYLTDTDYYGEAFLVYDDGCGDLCDSYGKLLLADGFVYSADESSVDENYYFYYKTLEDDSYLYVQTDYTDGYFEIFAWIEVPAETYASFPYEAINNLLGTSLSETNFPSFDVDEGESYYFSVYDESYALVYGYLNSATDDDDFYTDYEEALTGMGFTIDESYYAATNETLNVEVAWYAEDGIAYLYVYTLSDAE